MAAARRPAARVGPASRFPQVNYCDFATLLAALSATVASALSSAVAAALASTALSATLPAAFSTALSAALSSAVAAALAAAVAAALLPAAAKHDRPHPPRRAVGLAVAAALSAAVAAALTAAVAAALLPAAAVGLTLPAVPSVSPSPSSVSLSPLRRPCRRRRLGSVAATATASELAAGRARRRKAAATATRTEAATATRTEAAKSTRPTAAGRAIPTAAAATATRTEAAKARPTAATATATWIEAAKVRSAAGMAKRRKAAATATRTEAAKATRIGLAFAASVRVAVAASAVGFAFVACSVRVALAAVTIRHTHSLHICKFFLMYTAVQPLAISGQLKASTLSPKPLCPALAAVLFGAMAGVEAPNPGAAEPVQRQHQQPLSLILKTVPAGISKIVLKWIPGEWHLISRTGSFNNQVMSPLNVHVRGLRQRPSDQPSRAICDPSTPSRLGRGRPPPAAPLTSPPR